MKCKRTFTAIAAAMLCLALTATAIIVPDAAYADTAAGQKYYHLDIGVWCLPYNGSSWDKGIAYGSIQPNSTDIAFGSNIKVVGAHVYQGESDVFQFGTENCSDNVPGHSGLAYDEIYSESASLNITNVNAKNAGSNVCRLSYNVLLQSAVENDRAVKARKLLEQITTYQETITTYNQDVYVLTGSERTLKENALKKYKGFRDTAQAEYNKTKAARQKILVQQYNNLIKGIEDDLSETKTIQRTISSYQTALGDTSAQFEAYKADTYKFWGGAANLQEYNNSVYTALQNVWTGALENSNLKLDLVFIPIVIEYEKTTKTCKACGECELDINSPDDVCSSGSCQHFGTAECGCYQIAAPVDPSGSCRKSITWSETQSHKYRAGTKANGKPRYRTCNHVYTYTATLSTSATLAAAKPNGTSTTFKSGYGFTVNLNNSVTAVQVSNSGKCGSNKSKAYSSTIVAPTGAEVRTSWTVKNAEKKTTQSKTVALTQSSVGSLASSFKTSANPVSNYNNAQIYTDVALKGTKSKPVKHTVEVYTYGGGVKGVQFCQSIPLTFTINGDMYEDDWTVDRI